MAAAKLATLYKRGKGEKIQEWIIEIDGPKYRTIEGFTDGIKTTSMWTHTIAKNIGKKNEVSPEEQASKEAQAKWKKKTESGYTPDINEVDAADVYQVTLAHEYSKNTFRVVFPIDSQPKLDGMRCYIKSTGMWSRENKPVVSAPHVFEAVKHVFESNPNLVLDGELYNHTLKDDFNAIISHVRKSKPNEEDLAASAKIIQYHMYDCDFGGNNTNNFTERYKILRGIWEKCDNNIIKLVPTTRVGRQDDLDKVYEIYLEKGYEGQMIRNPESIYEHRRSNNLLKRKEFITEDFEIVAVIEGEGNRGGMFGKFVLKLPNSSTTFEANARGSYDYYKEIWENKEAYIGKKATHRFVRYTPAGIPKHGAVIAIRDYE
jgi:DNA ligase-1